MSDPTGVQQRKRRTLWWLTALATAMFGFGFAMVPLYGLLCEVTGMQSVERMGVLGNGGAGGDASGEGRWVTDISQQLATLSPGVHGAAGRFLAWARRNPPKAP